MAVVPTMVVPMFSMEDIRVAHNVEASMVEVTKLLHMAVTVVLTAIVLANSQVLAIYHVLVISKVLAISQPSLNKVLATSQLPSLKGLVTNQ